MTTAAELSRGLALNPTGLARLLRTLHQRGFVLRVPGGLYALGPILASLGQKVSPGLRAQARPAMERLSAETGETVVLWLLDGNDGMAADQVVGDTHLVRVQFAVGSRSSLELASGGRVLLAFQKEPFVERVIARAANPERLRGLIEEIRTKGYGVSHDELQRGVHGAAAPILGPDGHALACLALIVPTARADRVDDHIGALLASVAEVSGDPRNA